MSLIKSFEEACEKSSLDASKLPDVSMLPIKHQKAIVANYKLFVIAEALNDGWVPDWNDSNEWKYYPWFYMSGDKDNVSGSAFSYYHYADDHSYSNAGSRLSYKSSELAEYAGNTFLDLYKDLFIMD